MDRDCAGGVGAGAAAGRRSASQTAAGQAVGGAGGAGPPRGGGKVIDTDVGHAAPFVGDFYGDGKRHLLVGQFGDGILWIYRNEGTNTQPKFAERVKFGGRVPTG